MKWKWLIGCVAAAAVMLAVRSVTRPPGTPSQVTHRRTAFVLLCAKHHLDSLNMKPQSLPSCLPCQ